MMNASKLGRRTVRAIGSAALTAAAALALSSRADAATPAGTVRYDLRVHGTGAKTVDVTHSGQSVIFDLFATVYGLDSNPNNDAIGSGIGMFTSSTGGLLGNLLGLGPPAPFNTGAPSPGAQNDADGDGDLDVWSAGTAAGGKYAFRQPPPYPLPQPAGGALVAQVQFTVGAFSLAETSVTWKHNVGSFSLVATADAGQLTQSTAIIDYGVPVTVRGVTVTPPPGVTYMSGNIAAHTSITQETWVSPSQSLTFETGVDIASGGALNSAGQTLQINVNDASSGNFGGAIVGANVAIGTTADGTFTQAGGTNEVGNVTVGNTAARTGTLNVTGGSIAANALTIGGAGTGVFTQSGGVTDAIQLNIRNAGATVSDGALIVRGNAAIGGGSGNSGSFTQTGGTSNISGDLTVGGSGGNGQLVINNGTMLTATTRVGPGGGNGSVQVSGTGVFKPGTLVLNSSGFSTGNVNVAVSGGGQVFTNSLQFTGPAVMTQSGGTVSGPIYSTINLSNSPGEMQYVLSGGTLAMTTVRVAKTNSAPLAGSGRTGGFVQTGGTLNAHSMTIETSGTANIVGGTTNITSMLNLRGTLDYGGSAALLNVKTNAFASFVKGQLLAANNATFTGANGSLISFKDQAQYDSVGHINSSGIVHIAGQPVVVQQNQSIGGSGTIEGNVANNGTIAPGASPGALEINGSYTQAATGSLLMEIAGTDAELFDTLSATGPASLDGLLNVALLDGFVPSASDSFRILSASSVSGTFDNVVGGKIAFSDGQFNVAYSPSGVTLSNFAPVPEPGAFALIGLAMTTAIARRRRA